MSPQPFHLFESLIRSLYHQALELLPSEIALQIQFLTKHGRVGNFRKPHTFSEKLQWRKLFADDSRFVAWSDKVQVKAIVAEMIGSEWIIPTIWDGPALPEQSIYHTWPVPFVIKDNHGSGRNIFIRTESELDWDRILQVTRGWILAEWPPYLHETFYNKIDRRLLVEPIIGLSPLIDYKFFCFAGSVKYIQVDIDRFTMHRRCLFDRNWVKQDFTMQFPLYERDVDPPVHLAEMITAAECLSKDFDFVRIDLYDTPTRPLFGEATFIPGSGFERFTSQVAERELGAAWRVPQM